MNFIIKIGIIMNKIVIFGSTGYIGDYFTDYCNNMIDKKHSFIGVKAMLFAI